MRQPARHGLGKTYQTTDDIADSFLCKDKCTQQWTAAWAATTTSSRGSSKSQRGGDGGTCRVRLTHPLWFNAAGWTRCIHTLSLITFLAAHTIWWTVPLVSLFFKMCATTTAAQAEKEENHIAPTGQQQPIGNFLCGRIWGRVQGCA